MLHPQLHSHPLRLRRKFSIGFLTVALMVAGWGSNFLPGQEPKPEATEYDPAPEVEGLPEPKPAPAVNPVQPFQEFAPQAEVMTPPEGTPGQVEWAPPSCCPPAYAPCGPPCGCNCCPGACCPGQCQCQCCPGCGGRNALSPHDPIHRLFPQTGWIRARGWLDAGYMYNTANPGSSFNGPYNAIDRDEGMFNQAYFIIDRVLRDDGNFDVGGRVDLLYGFDYILAQSVGLEVNRDGTSNWNSSQYYGLALPQAYIEAGNNELSVKAGHFYSIVGYEGVQAPANFFYSHAYSYQFAGPFTHWGGIATWNPNKNWTINAGLHNGWNTLDAAQNNVSFIGGVRYTSDDRDWWSSFAITSGQEPNNVAGLPGIVPGYNNRTRYSLLFDKEFSNGVEYVFHHWLGLQQNGVADGSAGTWYGIDQYLYYRLNKCHKLGTRFEWFRDEDGTRVGLNRPSNPNIPPLPGNYFSWSIGENWTPIANLTLRPELRYDVYSGSAKPFDDGNKRYQVLLGFDAIYQF